ncbi:MAG TPA: glycosyltransferase [Clostridia bacterium]|nr:glycosyltransferase [Clostridia bacterium]
MSHNGVDHIIRRDLWKAMKVALVTSWPTRWCGIATYSLELSRALENLGLDVNIVCHHDEPGLPPTGLSFEKGVLPKAVPCHYYENVERPGRIHPVINQLDPGWYLSLQECVREVEPDVVHIQHEFGLYSLMTREGEFAFLPEDAFALVIPMFYWKVRRIPVVVTLHSVFTRLTFGETVYYDTMASLAHALIVHEPYQKTALEEMVGRRLDNVFVCPHGTLPDGIPETTRTCTISKWTEDRDAVIAGMIGWWEPNKGFERVIEMWPSVVKTAAETGHEVVLVIAGEVRPGSPTGPGYNEKVLRMVDASPARDHIRLEFGRFSEEEYRAVLGSFDFLILPYTHASQSGNHAHAYGLGVPAVASAIEGLKSSIEASGGGLLAEDDRALRERILDMVRLPELRKELAERAWKYATEVISWSLVAERHMEVYDWSVRMARDPSRYARYLEQRVHV